MNTEHDVEIKKLQVNVVTFAHGWSDGWESPAECHGHVYHYTRKKAPTELPRILFLWYMMWNGRIGRRLFAWILDLALQIFHFLLGRSSQNSTASRKEKPFRLAAVVLSWGNCICRSVMKQTVARLFFRPRHKWSIMGRFLSASYSPIEETDATCR